jgi:ATP-binding cassette subfamily B protein
MATNRKIPLAARFPSLQKLRTSRRSVPEIRQLTATDCGAACLAMVSAYFGREVGIEEVRDLIGSTRDGVSGKVLLEAARRIGLRGRGVSLEVGDLKFLAPGAILHWQFSHFVVLERVTRRDIHIVDPATGRRRVGLEQVQQLFTGVALLMEPAEDFQKQAHQKSAFRHVTSLIRYSGLVTRIFLVSIALQFLGILGPILVGLVVDRVVPHRDYELLFVLSLGLGAIVAFRLLTSLVRGHLLLELRARIDASMTLGFLHHLVSLTYSFFQLRPAGDLLARMNTQSSVREILSNAVISALLDGALVSVFLVLLFVVDYRIALLILALWLVQVLVFYVSRKLQRSLLSRGLELQARQQNYQIALLTSMQTLKAFGVEERMLQGYSHLFVDVLNVELRRGRLMNWVDSVISTLHLAAPLLLLVAGSYRVLTGGLTLGEMLSANALAGSLLIPLSNLLGVGGQFLLLDSYLERMNDVLDMRPERPSRSVGRQARLGGAIALDHVSFRYGPHSPLAVRDVTLGIEPGQMVAIVGRSGAGKSSLANLLLGLYLPTSGSVRYDAIDLNELDLQCFRSQIGVVLQESSFIDGTIRDNIALNDDGISMARLVAAAKRASIHDEIMAMPLQYHTPLPDRGLSLSGGQRQRLALARALARDPSILLLDEATSALDAISERAILKTLNELSSTRIIIAHRLSTIRSADLILVMDAGRIVESGRHEELLERRAAYAELMKAQLDGSVRAVG